MSKITARRSRGIFYRKRLKNTPPVLFAERFLSKSVLLAIHFFHKSVVLALKEPNIGTLRETFFCNQLGYQHQVEYSKQGDFLIDHQITFEIGGQTKEGKQVAAVENAYIVADDIEYSYGNKLPIWLFGLLY